MDSHTLQPAPKPSIAPVLTAYPAKHALYAWRSENLFEDNGTLFRGICYSINPGPDPGWVNIGAVGCLFGPNTIFPAPAPTREVPNPVAVQGLPLVQFARSVTDGVAYSVELAPSAEKTVEYEQWHERRSARFGGAGVVLGYVIPSTNSQPGQLSRPLYTAQVRGEDGLPLNQALTTDRTTWRNFVDQVPTAFGLENPVVNEALPLAQISPIYEVEIDVVAGAIVPTVTVGRVGEFMGDLEVPPGPGSMIRFSRQFDASFALDHIVVRDSSGSVAPDFVAQLNTDATILIANTAPPGLYNYTIFVTLAVTGELLHLDPKIRNRSDGGS